MNYKQFFGRKAEVVAKDLLGRLIVRTTQRGVTAGKIIETGAYEGGKLTNSRRGMLYPPGSVFLMPFRGFQLFNISTEAEYVPSCVEIRKLAFHDRTLEGAGAVSKALGIEKELDSVFFNSAGLEISRNAVEIDRIQKIEGEGLSENCLGYFSIK